MDAPKRVAKTIVLPFSELPFEGLEFDVQMNFEELSRSKGEIAEFEDLKTFFTEPVHVHGLMTPVGSKVDIRGSFEGNIRETCDRCAGPFSTKIEGDISTFLMPDKQFSAYDKPGGKVIHAPTRGQKKSRHHSATKAPVLSDAEGEHEDVNFGAFDGEMIDLRGILREQMILSLPMTAVCSEACQGLCVRCGENISKKECHCSEGPEMVSYDEAPEALSPFQEALKSKTKALRTT